jgi:hypothetical protein
MSTPIILNEPASINLNVPAPDDWSETIRLITSAVTDHINKPDQLPRVDVVTISKSTDPFNLEVLVLHVRILPAEASGGKYVPIIVHHNVNELCKSVIYVQHPRFIDEAARVAASRQESLRGSHTPYAYYTGDALRLTEMLPQMRDVILADLAHHVLAEVAASDNAYAV